DISDCLKLEKLPAEIGKLGCLRTIHMRGCMGLKELPPSVNDLCLEEVVCDTEVSLLWSSDHPDVKLREVEEDKLGTLMKIIAS
ncbi:probable disease resistance protein, partial [Tanacetum coccineum]